jgi:hypothetical protein
MVTSGTVPVPSHHTAEGGVLVGTEDARHRLVLFEDPQCPYCRQFEETTGGVLRRPVASGAVVVEYRMRCFLGTESVRADNALALAAEADRFDELRRQLFAHQPAESTGGFTVADLIELGGSVGLSGPDYVTGVRQGRYQAWVIGIDRVLQEQDPQGTPTAVLDGREVDPELLFDPEAFVALLRS